MSSRVRGRHVRPVDGERPNEGGGHVVHDGSERRHGRSPCDGGNERALLAEPPQDARCDGNQAGVPRDHRRQGTCRSRTGRSATVPRAGPWPSRPPHRAHGEPPSRDRHEDEGGGAGDKRDRHAERSRHEVGVVRRPRAGTRRGRRPGRGSRCEELRAGRRHRSPGCPFRKNAHRTRSVAASETRLTGTMTAA